jgi:hypothetical protein
MVSKKLLSPSLLDQGNKPKSLLERLHDMARKRNKHKKKVNKLGFQNAYVKDSNPVVERKSTYNYSSYDVGACHGKKLVNAFDIGKVKIFLGAKVDLPYHANTLARTWSLVINLSGLPYHHAGGILDPNEAAKRILPPKLCESIGEIPMIDIDWPDGCTPKLSDSWFQGMADWLKSLDSGNIAICCVGGHGRTGTLATVLAGLCGVIPKRVCPVDWLRKAYCQEVVESESQIVMIERILDRRVYATESYGVWPSYYDDSDKLGYSGTASTSKYEES